MSKVEELQRELDAARAESASLRAKMAKVRGALYFFRKPPEKQEDVFAPIDAWDWNPNAARDLGAAYGSLAELLNDTRPEANEGMAVLIELRDLRHKVHVLTLESLTCKEPDGSDPV